MSECPHCNDMRTETIRALSEKATAKNQVGQYAAYIKALEGGAKEKDARISAITAENERLREARTELRTELEAAYKLLRRGQRAIDRQEWEKGETASEWYSAAGTFCGSYEARSAIDAARSGGRG